MSYDDSRLTPDDEYHDFGSCFDMLCDDKRRKVDEDIDKDIEYEKRELKRRGGTIDEQTE